MSEDVKTIEDYPDEQAEEADALIDVAGFSEMISEALDPYMTVLEADPVVPRIEPSDMAFGSEVAQDASTIDLGTQDESTSQLGEVSPIDRQIESMQTDIDDLKAQIAELLQEDTQFTPFSLPDIVIDDDVPEFTGCAYAPNGTKTAELNIYSAKAWIKWSTYDYAFTEETGPPASPWGSDEVWFEKASTYGDIVVSRLG